MSYKYRRKSIQLLPGIKLNLNKRSTSITVGGKRSRTTINSKGVKTHSSKVPGTNITRVKRSYPESHNASKSHYSSNQNRPHKMYSPKTYRVCGIILIITSILLLICGFITISSGGVLFIILGLFFIVPGYFWSRNSFAPPDHRHKM